jgi:hypothetical protein
MELSYLLVDSILTGSKAQIYSQSYMALVEGTLVDAYFREKMKSGIFTNLYKEIP